MSSLHLRNCSRGAVAAFSGIEAILRHCGKQEMPILCPAAVPVHMRDASIGSAGAACVNVGSRRGAHSALQLSFQCCRSKEISDKLAAAEARRRAVSLILNDC